MSLMKAVQIAKPGADLVLIDKEIPQPGDREVLIKVEAGRVSGVVGTDLVSPYRFDANRLRMEFPQYLFTTSGSRSARVIVTWEREN